VIHSYATSRGRNRTLEAAVVRHAVDEVAHLCGALDSECGKTVSIDLGPWVPDDPRNCRGCTLRLSRRKELAA
jgi:hypothetical protein